MKYRLIRGTRDLYGADALTMRRIEDIASALCARYGYQEIRTPVFEEADLFVRSVGEHTDIITKEMYTFTDRKGRALTLRPEGTASVARAFIEHHLDQSPGMNRLFYAGAMYRYEKPQAGRFREFWQVGAEFFSPETLYSSLEIITLAWDLLDACGLTERRLKLNSLGCGLCRGEYTQALIAYARQHADELCSDCRLRITGNPLRVLDCKKQGCTAILSAAPPISEFWDAACRGAFDRLTELLTRSGIPFTVDQRLVRGLDYYNGCVFEIVAGGLGSQDAVLAGGRYDSLLKDLSGPDIPAVGFALGMDRLAAAIPRQPPQDALLPLIFLAPLGEQGPGYAALLGRRLRKDGFRVICDAQKRSVKALLRQANNLGARFVLIIGDDEVAGNTVTLKDLASGSQQTCPADEIALRLREAGTDG